MLFSEQNPINLDWDLVFSFILLFFWNIILVDLVYISDLMFISLFFWSVLYVDLMCISFSFSNNQYLSHCKNSYVIRICDLL